ncbi:hypothetical protein [Roseibium sediminicola]|uniref:Uncharacterized protein n=1 Tax=Roseibium sediminicola TaxID=2933272 RepID=A0ABT0GQ11_9HYPH|nr:hypothetical protein [Roseibium sp. CAU 1639]MCK7611521.1 hypothetical protein [Roseibium sp. CAU 1639]
MAQAQNVSCTCRYKGQDYGLGESICLKGSDGMRMATCAMVLNNTSWEFSNAPCPLSQWQGISSPFDRGHLAPESRQPRSSAPVPRPS